MNELESLLKEYEELGSPSGGQLRNKKYKDFKKRLKEALSYLENMNGKVSMSHYIYALKHQMHEPPECPTCGSKITTVGDTSFRTYCSVKCMSNAPKILEQRQLTSKEKYGHTHHFKNPEMLKKQQQTNLERYGVECVAQNPDVQQRIKQTLLDRYGAPVYFSSVDFREKTEETCLERHGVTHPASSEFKKQRVKEVILERYGVDHIMKMDHVKDKVSATMLERYGVTHAVLLPEVQKKSKEAQQSLKYSKFSNLTQDILEDQKKLQTVYDYFGSIYRTGLELGVCEHTTADALRNHDICIRPVGNVSSFELDVRRFIEEIYSGQLETNTRSIVSGYDFDMVLIEHSLIIECNGVYWHSEKFKDRKYHQKKTIAAHDNNYDIIHVWEDDWNDPIKQEIIKNKIKSKIGLSSRVYARKCSIVELTSKEASIFLNRNHIQGKTTASCWDGLQHDGNIVAVMGVRNKNNGEWELNRYATSMTVVGGFSKLLAYFKQNNEWSEIVTFAHLDYSRGNLYEKTGFKRGNITPPGLWYMKKGIRHNRQNFMKYKIKDKLEFFDPSLSEKDNMKANGFVRIYDAGSIKYTLHPS